MAPTRTAGTNLLHDKDVDGKEFVKERIDLAKTASSFWQSYKFMNPMTKTIEPRDVLRAGERHCRLRRRLSILNAASDPRCGEIKERGN